MLIVAGRKRNLKEVENGGDDDCDYDAAEGGSAMAAAVGTSQGGSSSKVAKTEPEGDATISDLLAASGGTGEKSHLV